MIMSGLFRPSSAGFAGFELLPAIPDKICSHPGFLLTDFLKKPIDKA